MSAHSNLLKSNTCTGFILTENLGIRLENDMVITNDGLNDLMQDIPIEADEIEELMN